MENLTIEQFQEAQKTLNSAQKALNSALNFIGEIAWNRSVSNNASFYARDYLAQIAASQYPDLEKGAK